MDACVVPYLVVVDADIELCEMRQDSSHPRTDLTQRNRDVPGNSLGFFLFVISVPSQVSEGPRRGSDTDSFTSVICFLIPINAG